MIRLNVSEVANFLQTSPGWVYANAAKLGGVKVGKYWRFTKTALDHFLVYGYAPGREPETSNSSSEVTVCGKSEKEEKTITLTSMSTVKEYGELLGLPTSG